MSAPVTINVTAAHIEYGKRGNCEECPIVLAARVAFPDADKIAANAGGLYVTRDGLTTEYVLPEEASRFVPRFDTSQPVGPFSFTVYPYSTYAADGVLA